MVVRDRRCRRGRSARPARRSSRAGAGQAAPPRGDAPRGAGSRPTARLGAVTTLSRRPRRARRRPRQQRHRRELRRPPPSARPASGSSKRRAQDGHARTPPSRPPREAATRSRRTRRGRRAACRRRSRRARARRRPASTARRSPLRAARAPSTARQAGAGPTSGSSVAHARDGAARRLAAHALDLDPREVGRGVLQRLLIVELQRRRRRRRSRRSCPRSRSCATPSSTPTSSTSPPCDAMYGRTASSASRTRVSRSTGWSPWISSRLPTTPSSTSAVRTPSASARPPRAPDDPLQAGAVQLEHRAEQLVGRLARTRRRSIDSSRTARAPGRARPARSPARPAAGAVLPSSTHPAAHASPVGVCTTFFTRPAAEVHVHAAGQAGVEAADRAHDVDALEVLGAVLLEDRRVLHRVLVRARRPVHVTRAGVPRRRRVGLVVGDLAVADDHVVREHAARRLVEADADGLLGHREVVPALRAAGADLLEGLLEAVEADQRRVGLVVGPGTVALDGVRPLRDLPLELHLRACWRVFGSAIWMLSPVALR